MVRIEDVTGRDKAAQEKLECVVSLAERCFCSSCIVSSCEGIVFVRPQPGQTTENIAIISPFFDLMGLSSEKYLEDAKNFAKAYENQFPLPEGQEFLIQTDYSGKR